MRQQQRETRSQIPPFSGHSLLYTVYRHHYGLSHEQAVLRIEAAMRNSMTASRHEEQPHAS